MSVHCYTKQICLNIFCMLGECNAVDAGVHQAQRAYPRQTPHPRQDAGGHQAHPLQ